MLWYSGSDQGGAGDDATTGSSDIPQDDDLESTAIRSTDPEPAVADVKTDVTEARNPVLGVVVVYSDAHDSDEGPIDPRLGRVYPLRAGEILFVGRRLAPAEVKLSSGEVGTPTYSHLFPDGGLYAYISRQHLTIEMEPEGETILTDTSTHGVYLVRASTWHRRQGRETSEEPHRLIGDEQVILMDDLGEPTEENLAERRGHYTLHIIRASSAKASNTRTKTES